MEPKVLKHTARADAVRLTARAPPRAPALATHGLNVCCKKTNRAPQRTYLLSLSVPVNTSSLSVSKAVLRSLPTYMCACSVARHAREASLRARGCARRVVPRSHGPGGVPRSTVRVGAPAVHRVIAAPFKNHPRCASSAAG